MRFSGRPGLIQGRRFHALHDKIIAMMSCGAHGSWCAEMTVRRASTDHPGPDREYWVTRLLDELASEVRESRYRPMAARRALKPKPGTDEIRFPLIPGGHSIVPMSSVILRVL
jgi:hypothetical protein